MMIKAGLMLPFVRPFSSKYPWHEFLPDNPIDVSKQEPSEKQKTIIPSKTLTIYNTHTGEWLKKCTFHADGVFISESITMINQLFRDHRTGTTHVIDKKLLLLLHSLMLKLDTQKPIHLVSGYRSHETNTCLHENSSGVAKKSLHCVGMAADLFIEGISHKHIQKAALTLKAGGVGRYTHFVHVDTGRVRRWGMPAT